MNTKSWNTGDVHFAKEAAELLKRGEVVAFPTETVYGLGADATNEEAVKKIFQAKGRPSDNPLIIHISNASQLEELAEEIPDSAKSVMQAYWPGPLTIVFKRKAGSLANAATAGLETVAVRMPDHPVALAIIEAAGLPIAAPSANRSGKPSPTTAEHVAHDLIGRISGIVDGGETGVGVESTVLDCTEMIPVILRPGGVTKEELESVIGPVKEDTALINKEAAPRSPGMKYVHYAPDAPLILLDGGDSFMQQFIDEQKGKGLRVGVLVTAERSGIFSADEEIVCGSRKELSSVASGLYQALRAFDARQVDVIIGEVFPREGIGEAIMNRLEKAAGHRILKENS